MSDHLLSGQDPTLPGYRVNLPVTVLSCPESGSLDGFGVFAGPYELGGVFDQQALLNCIADFAVARRPFRLVEVSPDAAADPHDTKVRDSARSYTLPVCIWVKDRRMANDALNDSIRKLTLMDGGLAE